MAASKRQTGVLSAALCRIDLATRTNSSNHGFLGLSTRTHRLVCGIRADRVVCFGCMYYTDQSTCE